MPLIAFSGNVHAIIWNFWQVSLWAVNPQLFITCCLACTVIHVRFPWTVSSPRDSMNGDCFRWPCFYLEFLQVSPCEVNPQLSIACYLAFRDSHVGVLWHSLPLIDSVDGDVWKRPFNLLEYFQVSLLCAVTSQLFIARYLDLRASLSHELLNQ